MILSQYPYKDHLQLSSRLAIAQTYVRLDGYRGLVTELATDFQTNRQQIYAILSDVEHGFAPQLPGPKPVEESGLVERIATLEATNKLLERENEHLQRRLGQSIEVTPERLERLLFTGIGEMLPYETIQTIVKVAYRPEFAPSVGHLSRLANHAGTIAGLILNDERVTSAFQAAACDEIFFHQQPILTVVEPDSMAIGAIEKMGNRTAFSWQAVLSHFPKLRYVISDLARGLIKGVQLSGHLLHQGDLFHFLRDVGRTTQRLERRLQRLLKEEADAWDKWCDGHIYTKTLEKVLARSNTFLAQMEQYYQSIERLSDAFWPMTEAGDLLTERQARQIIADVVQRFSALEAVLGLKSLMKQVRNAQDHCLAYLREISYQLGRLVENLPEMLPIEKNQFLRLAIEDVCLRYAFSQGAQLHREYLSLWDMLWPLGGHLATFHALVQKVSKILYTPKRASSLVESVNSKLRTVQYIKKNVTQEYLWLLALKHNIEPFPHGKRKGLSPFELLGIDLGTNDWVDLVRTYQL
jgi:hypothetical protein